jgi:signal peptidase II
MAACAFAVLAINLLLERMLTPLAAGFALVPGLAEFHPAWNRGVSFSLLMPSGAAGQYLLMALLSVIAAAVAVMGWRATAPLPAAGFGLILGGALGNLCDRALYDGAVFDFLFLHLGPVPLFVCNFSDIAISAGVLLLVLDSAGSSA